MRAVGAARCSINSVEIGRGLRVVAAGGRRVVGVVAGRPGAGRSGTPGRPKRGVVNGVIPWRPVRDGQGGGVACVVRRLDGMPSAPRLGVLPVMRLGVSEKPARTAGHRAAGCGTDLASRGAARTAASALWPRMAPISRHAASDRMSRASATVAGGERHGRRLPGRVGRRTQQRGRVGRRVRGGPGRHPDWRQSKSVLRCCAEARPPPGSPSPRRASRANAFRRTWRSPRTSRCWRVGASACSFCAGSGRERAPVSTHEPGPGFHGHNQPRGVEATRQPGR